MMRSAWKVAVITAFLVFGSAISFALQAVIARQFGAGAAVDAYLYAMSLPLFVYGLVSAAMSYALTPIFVGLSGGKGPPGHDVGVLRQIAMLALLTLPLSLALGWFMAILGPHLPGARSDLVRRPEFASLVQLCWAFAGLQIATSVITIYLNSVHRPVIAAWFGTLNGTGAVVAAIFGSAFGLGAVVWGYIAGASLTLIIGLIVGRRHLLPPARPDFRAPVWRSMWRSTASALISTTSYTLWPVIDSFWAPLLGPGALAHLGFSQRVMIGIGSFFLTGPSMVLVPRLAAQIAAGEVQAFRRRAVFTVFAVSLAAAGASVGLYVLAPWLVRLAFQHGRFTVSDASVVVLYMRWMTPGFGMMLVNVIVTRILFCIEAGNKWLSGIGLLWCGLYFGLSGILIRYTSAGIPIAYSISWCVTGGLSALLFAWMLSRPLPAAAGATAAA